MKGCPSKEFFEGVVRAANELKKQRGLHECISDYNRLCGQFEVPIEAARGNRLDGMYPPSTGTQPTGTSPKDLGADPGDTGPRPGIKKYSYFLG